MLWAGLFVIWVVAFNQILRGAQRRGIELFVAIAANYAVGAALSGVLWVVKSGGGSSEAVGMALLIGGVNGVLYFLHLLLIQTSYRLAGVGITAALIGIGSVLPVVTSWAVWGEPMTTQRWVATVLLIPAVVLLRPRADGRVRLSVRTDVVLALVCVVAGVIGILHKTAEVYASVGGDATYQFVLFTAAAVCSCGYVVVRHLRWPWPSVSVGVSLGTANFLATACLLAALSALPATMVFPVTAPSCIVANAVLARLLWRERMARRQVVGMVIALAVVILASV